MTNLFSTPAGRGLPASSPGSPPEWPPGWPTGSPPRSSLLSSSARAGRLGLVAAALSLLMACAINPVTGERELALISEEQEIAMGRVASGQVAESVGLVENESLQQYVSGVGQRLAADSERPELPWQFRVVDDPTPNAFALPGGYIFVTRGLMNLLTSEAELAAVVGHEIGHVTARHSVVQMSRAQLAQLGLGLGMVLSPELAQFGDLAGSGVQLLFLKYGRDDERQADELSFRYMLDQGYDVTEMDDVFRALLDSGELSGQSPLPSWLASHPAEPERIANAEARVEALGSLPADLRTGEDVYLDRLDGMVYGENPRNGFFRGDWFYHPELIFRFRVPQDWQRQNLPSTVQGVSPNRDAAVELSLVPGASPAEAAAAFLSRQGIVRLGSVQDELAGNDAVVSEFEAQAQGGVVHGYVTHVAHGNSIYQIVGFAPNPSFGQSRELLHEIVTSFEPVRDRAILDIEPQRINIVELPRAMTLAEFAREYPSPLPLEEIALINQVPDPDETLPAGKRLKQVTGEPLE